MTGEINGPIGGRKSRNTPFSLILEKNIYEGAMITMVADKNMGKHRIKVFPFPNNLTVQWFVVLVYLNLLMYTFLF